MGREGLVWLIYPDVYVGVLGISGLRYGGNKSSAVLDLLS